MILTAFAAVACANAPEPARNEAPDAYGRAWPAEITVVGTVRSGVERGCLVVSAKGRTHQLIGGDPEVVRPGAHLSVRGRPDPGLVTTCMQGEPLHVSEAKPT